MLRSSILARFRNGLITRGDHHHHYKGYNEPTGHLFGIPPAPPGYRRKKLYFENIWIYLYGGTMVAFFIGMYYKPSDEIQAWAKQEALDRIVARKENWSDKDF